MNRPLDYYVLERKGRLQAKFVDKETRALVTEKSVAVIAKEMKLDFDGSASKRGNRRKAEDICKLYIEKVLTKDMNEKGIIQYCLDFWNFDGERVTLANKKSPNAVARSTCYVNTGNFTNHIKPYMESLGNPLLSEVTSQMLNEIQDDLIMSSGLSNAMIEKTMRSVTTPINDAWKHGLVDRPVRVDRIDTTGKEKGILTPLQLTEIVRNLFELEKAGYHIGANEGIALASLTGMRMGEVRALKVDQFEIVDEQTSIIHITRTWNEHDHEKIPKGKRARQVTAPTVIVKACIELAEKNPHKTGRVFWVLRNPDSVRSKTFFEDNLYKAMKAAGISEEDRKSKNITFHSLRHGFVSYLRYQVSDSTMRLAVGHKDKETTDKYTHLNMDNLKELAESTEKTFADVIAVQNGN